MKVETIKEYIVFPLNIPPEVKEKQVVYLFSSKYEKDFFPWGKIKYTTRKLKNGVNYYLPIERWDQQAKDCLSKLKGLKFDLSYGLARDAMKHLKNNGLIEL